MTTRLIPFSLIVIAGCGGTANDPHVPADGPPPISGGTLYVAAGNLAIASDPDRAAIHVVDLGESRQLHRLQLAPTDEPGRIVQNDQDGRVHVVLRRAGDVLTIDPQAGSILERRRVCAAPRGIAVDPDSHELVVACADGVLVRMPAQGTEGTRRIRLAPDLRDVVALSGGKLVLTRFRDAEVLWVENDEIVRRARPADSDETAFTGTERIMTATVAYNLRQISSTQALLVHQQSQATQLGVLGAPALGAQYYGGDCSLGVVRSVLTLVNLEPSEFVPAFASSAAVSGASLVVDGTQIAASTYAVTAAADPGASADPDTFLPPAAGLRIVTDSEFGTFGPTCTFGGGGRGATVNEPAVGVARYDGGYATLYRDPAVIRLSNGGEIALDAGPAHHFGHALFHEAAGSGATCAGCHPEGGDDGRVWLFDTGARRTQTMTGGILETAPFHWAGDILNAAAVMEGTFVGRMGGAPPREDEIAEFEQWVDRIPSVPGEAIGTEAVDRGRALFESAQCATCHNGDRLTNNETVDVATGGRFQVPALYEVVYHEPYLHDGRAATLEEVLVSHGETETLSDTDRADLITYLRSL